VIRKAHCQPGEIAYAIIRRLAEMAFAQWHLFEATATPDVKACDEATTVAVSRWRRSERPAVGQTAVQTLRRACTPAKAFCLENAELATFAAMTRDTAYRALQSIPPQFGYKTNPASMNSSRACRDACQK